MATGYVIKRGFPPIDVVKIKPESNEVGVNGVQRFDEEKSWILREPDICSFLENIFH